MTSVKEISREGLNLEFEVKVPNQLFEEKVEKELTDLSKKVKIDGFRSGKVPLSVVKKKYLTSVRQDILQTLISESIDNIIKENNLNLSSSPSVDKIDSREGQDVSFVLKLEIMPEISAPDFSKVKLTKYECEISEDELNESLDRIVKANAQYKDAEDNAKANLGDKTIIDFVGKINGVAFDNGSGISVPLVLGSKSFIEGFEEQLVGMKKGDEKTISVTFPKEYHQADLAGKDAEFDIKMNQIQIAEEVEVNDAFAEKFGLTGLDDLKSKIRENLENQYKEISLTKTKKELFDLIEPLCNFEMPKSIYDREFTTLWNQVPAAEKNDPAIEEKYKKLSERRVKLGLLLSILVNSISKSKL